MKKKLFKNLIFVIVMAVLCLSVAMTASADYEISAGDSMDITVVAYETTYIKFIPVQSGVYSFTSSADDDTLGYLFNANKEEIIRNDDGAGAGNFKITYTLEKNVTYYFGARFYSQDWEGTFTVSLTLDEAFCEHENKIVETEGIEPTCYENGNSGSYYCPDCDTTIDNEVLLASHKDENIDGICERCEKTMPISSGTCGGVSYDEGMSDNGAVKYYLYNDGTLEIYGEGEITAGYFEDEDDITNVIIKDGITKINYDVFDYCDSLYSAIIPESVTYLSHAFTDCYNLETITIFNPDCEIYESYSTIDSNATIYGYEGSTAERYANKYGRDFVIYCLHESTTDVAEIPASCYTKGYTAGTKCNNCGNYVKGGEVTEPSHKDENTDGLCDLCEKTMPTETGSCGGNIYEFSSEYFNDGAVRYYKYADGTLEIFGEGAIKHYAFDYDNTITKVIIMDGITEILEEAFYECKKIESVSFPETLTFIDYFAFANCTNLKSVVLPNSIERFYSNVFDNCARLEEVVLPEAIYDIPGANFQGCIRLAKITVMNPDCKIASDPAVFPESATLYGHEGSTLQEYAEDWNRKFVVIGSEEDGGDDDGNIGGEVTPEIPHEHKFPAEWSVVTEATCSQNGIAIRICTQCSVFEYTVTPAYGHEDTDGDKLCDDCKVVVALPEEDEAPEETHTHSFPAQWTILTKATCSQSGIAVRACEGCLLYEYDTVPALGHNDADGDKFCDSCKVALSLPEIPSTPDAPEETKSPFAFLTDFFDKFKEFFRKLFNFA